jgi:hypothetical protein
METALAFDSKEFDKRIRAGEGPQVFGELADDWGISFDERLGDPRWLKPGIRTSNFKMACDAQPELVTQSNAGVPAYFANIYDPKVIAVLVSPMNAAKIVGGDTQKGNWVSETLQFLVAESTGLTSAYGDYSNNGMSNVNINFPSRQNFVWQAFINYGEREVEKAGLAKLDWVSQQQISNALALNKQENDVYFYGVGNLQNYGLITSPDLPPPITPTYSWLTSASANASTIYQDFVRMFIQLQAQTNGTLQMDAPMVVAMSPQNSVVLKEVTQYNTNSVEVLLKQNFPNLRIETAIQYATPSGQLVQMFCEELEGQRTVECIYSSKMRAHQLVAASSSWSQKRSASAFGAIWYRPMLCVSMLG